MTQQLKDRAAPKATPSLASHRLAGAILGVLVGAVALGVAHLVAGLVGASSSPVIAVGETVIDAVPGWLKTFAIRTFGTHDKLALLIGIGIILAIVAAVLGAVSMRRPRAGVVGICVLGLVGLLAALTRPGARPIDAIPALAGTAAGLVAFRLLRSSAGLKTGLKPGPQDPSVPRRAPGAPATRRPTRGGEVDRRGFLLGGIVAAGVAAVSGFAGEYLLRRSQASASRAAVRIPVPASPAPPRPPGVQLRVPGISSFVTPNDSFYRIDTALIVPAVNSVGWQLNVHGMVDHPLTLNYDELLKRPMTERDVTLTCVSNEVGGHLISNARWIGAPLKDLLEEAGVRPGADQIVSRSADGFTAGTPTAVAMDGRDAMLAVAMNGEALPLSHGFPVRMVVPGLYGYVSATKWLVDIELSTFADFDAYWIRRGWSQQGPIKTESRIDTPSDGATVKAGRVAVAGVAWAQHRGIGAVEVRVDGGTWEPAQLAAQDTVDTWRQWVYQWPATTGQHTLQVRATDDTGAVQTGVPAPPPPSGATGWHQIRVSVS
jgi:DMSO/TMAO reductase YedYZ molybdopterin-dependent catalytic subunit